MFSLRDRVLVVGEQRTMKTGITKHSKIAVIAVASCLAGAFALVNAQQHPAVETAIGSSDVDGVVTSMNGPEAGVWVIAETTDLPTKFAKMVVTDERGRYLIPELPKANYNVLVRGYGLVDSQRVKVTPGQHLNLTAVPAPTAAAAAEYYPGVYWYSMLQIPDRSLLPGTGPDGNGISPKIKTQQDWIDTIKNSCQSCHALGSQGVRRIPKTWGHFDNSVQAWTTRLQAGQAQTDRKSTRLNSSHANISYAVFCLKKKTINSRPYLNAETTIFQSSSKGLFTLKITRALIEANASTLGIITKNIRETNELLNSSTST